MKQNTPSVCGQREPGNPIGNAGKWEAYRVSFMRLVAEEARLQIVAGVSPGEMDAREQDALENAVASVECARLVYNDSRNILASTLSRRVEAFELQPRPGARTDWVSRVADLLSEFRGDGAGTSPADKRAAEKIVSAAQRRFLELQRV
jgi:hypothetical protein